MLPQSVLTVRRQFKFRDAERVFALPDDLKAPEIKGYIARMRMLVTARTHASIAGYSSFVPTLVIGYSVKAKGIAKDIYGTDETHVMDSHKLTAETLMMAFDALNERCVDEKRFLNQRLPEYIEERSDALQSFLKLRGR